MKVLFELFLKMEHDNAIDDNDVIDAILLYLVFFVFNGN